jgi:hypothetical protein
MALVGFDYAAPMLWDSRGTFTDVWRARAGVFAGVFATRLWDSHRHTLTRTAAWNANQEDS